MERPFFCVRSTWYSRQMRLLCLGAIMLISGCKDERPPAPTAQQAVQLNDAEDMLNDMARNEEGPADRSVGPSKSSD
jgi:hypothetical protein